jgi:SAM-dependent methyltransferase
MPLRFTDQRPPIPPVDLIQRITPPFPPEQAGGARQAFDEAPVRQLIGLERALAIVGREFSEFERMLDFGCGPGRYIRHLEPLSETTEIHGADIDGQMIDWLRKNVPYGHYEVVPHEPPTSYPDAHFDLVVNHSVFTHLPEHLQDKWMAELHRVTQPGGVLLLTVHSLPQWNQAISDMENGGEPVDHLRATLERDGILFISDDHFIGSTHPDFYHTTFHAPWYVFEHWTRWFDVAAYVPLGSDSQDLVVLRRRADDEPHQPPIGHGSRAASAPEPAASGNGRLPPQAAPQSTLGKIRRRVLSRYLGRQERINQELADALKERDRELRMLRTGLYELGHRVSVVTEELRAELDEARPERRDASRS